MMGQTPDPAVERSWYDIVGRFRDLAAKFAENYRALLAQRQFVAQRPALQAEYNALVSSAASIKSKIETVTRTIDNVMGWLRSLFGDADRRLGDLGVLPLVPIAVVAGALALMTKWLAGVYTFSRRLQEVKRLESTGVSPQQAAQIVATTAPAGGLLDSLTRNVGMLVAVGAAVWLLPMLLKRRSA